MEDIVLSILMVTYNHEKYIEDAILSIVQQNTQYSFELIIGDDASSDATAQIINKYTKKYSQIVHSVLRKENIGATKNSYSILRHARGKYIAFCDGDDVWYDKTRIQRQVEFLNTHPKYSSICGKCKLIDKDGIEIDSESIDEKRRFWDFNESVFILGDFERWKMPGHISAIMGRNVFQTGDCRILYKAHDIVGDRTFILLFALVGKVFCTQDIVSCYRIHNKGNFISEYQNKNLRYKDFCLMKSLEDYSKNMRKQKLDLSYIKRERLIGSVGTLINEPVFDSWKVVWNVIIQSDKCLNYLYITLKVIFLKLYYKHVLHEDRRIDF